MLRYLSSMWREKGFLSFLQDLNVEFDQVWAQILGRETLPSLNEVFSLVRAEEGRRTVMLEMPNPNSEGSAMMTIKGKTLLKLWRMMTRNPPTEKTFGATIVRRGTQKRIAGNFMASLQEWAEVEAARETNQRDKHISPMWRNQGVNHTVLRLEDSIRRRSRGWETSLTLLRNLRDHALLLKMVTI